MVPFFDHIGTLLIRKKRDEESSNAWHNRSHLSCFRNENINDIRCVWMNENHPGNNLLKVNDNVKRGNLKYALKILKIWCASNCECTCLKGVEAMFQNKLWLEMEGDCMLAIETVWECSSKHENSEILIFLMKKHL